MKLYLVSAEELEKLIELYDIENRKELIGDDNSLKRERRAIYKFLESKKPVGIIVDGVFITKGIKWIWDNKNKRGKLIFIEEE